MDDLDAQFARAEEKIIFAVKEVVKEIARTAYKFVIQNSAQVSGYGSPVLTGRYYTSHRITVNGIDASTSPPNPDAAPYPPLDPLIAEQALARYTLGDVITISNSVPYARELEAGWSAKTPQGIYNVSLQAAILEFVDNGVLRVQNTLAFEFPQYGRTAA
jgi:hypothetical protein